MWSICSKPCGGGQPPHGRKTNVPHGRRQDHVLPQRQIMAPSRHPLPPLPLVRSRPQLQAARHSSPTYHCPPYEPITIHSLHGAVRKQEHTTNKTPACYRRTARLHSGTPRVSSKNPSLSHHRHPTKALYSRPPHTLHPPARPTPQAQLR